MAQASIQVEADLRSATEQFVQFARRVRDTEGGLKALTGAAGKAAAEIEKTGRSHKEAGDKAGKHSESVSVLVNQFTAVAGVAAGVAKALQFLGEAHQAAIDLAKEGAEANRALFESYKNLSGAANYSLGGTIRDRVLAARLGVETKTDFKTAMAATAAGIGEGFSPDDVRTALQFQRVAGADPGRLFNVLDQAGDRGKGPGKVLQFVNTLIALRKQYGGTANENLDLLGKLAGSGAQLGYDPTEIAGLAAAVGDQLPGKKAAGAIDTVLQALASSVEVKGTPTAEQIALAQKTGVGPGQLGKTPVKLTGTALERLAQLQTLDPTKYRALTEDAQTGIVVNAIRGGALAPLATGDLLGAAVRAADADTYRQGTDAENQASSAAALTEAELGGAYQRFEAKRRLLIAALQQGGYGELAQNWATVTKQDWLKWFGSTRSLEQQIDDAAQGHGVSLNPADVVRGTAGGVDIGGGVRISRAERERIRSDAIEQAGRETGFTPIRLPFGITGYWGSGNDSGMSPQTRAEEIDAERLRERRQQEDAQMKEQTSAIHSLRQAIERKGPNGSLRDWRGDDLAVRAPRGFPDMSGRRYFG